MNERPRHSTPSHLEDESRGGETAQGGFMFQDGVLLSNLPRWLEHEGFDCLIRESIGDTEVRFFALGSGHQIDFFEAKNHRITPTQFWDEITRFREVAEGSGRTYRSFTLVSMGASEDVAIIGNALRRVRDPVSFYGEASSIPENSLSDFIRLVKNVGRSEQEAMFLYQRVDLRWDLGPAQRDSEALFRQAVEDCLPAFRDLPGRTVGDMFASLIRLVSGRINKPVSRIEIERALRGAIEPASLPPVPPGLIHTATQHDGGRSTDLRFQWDSFFGGGDRAYPPPEQWEKQVILPLRETRSWIVSNRSSRRITLGGQRRLSTALAFGSVFSAVSGFAVDVHHRGDVWPTDAHADSNTPTYELARSDRGGAGQDLVVAIGIARDILPEVEASLISLGLEGLPLLYLHGVTPLVSPQQGNLVTTKAKEAIARRVAERGAKVVHLFYAGPSHLAVFFGHRFNAIGLVQCYEWLGPGRYTPTCLLQT